MTREPLLSEGTVSALFFDQAQILVHGRPGKITEPCELADAVIAMLVRRVVLVEDCGDILLGRGLPADVLALGLRVLHSASYTGTDDREFKLGKDSADLDKGLRHGIDLPGAAINRNGAENDETHLLLLDRVNPQSPFCVQVPQPSRSFRNSRSSEQKA